MKKLVFVSSFCIATMFVANARSSRFGFTAGTSIANYNFKYAGTNISGDPKTGFTIGLFADIPTSANFSIQPALNFVQKGTQSEEMNEELSTSINCLEIPVNFFYKTAGKAGSFFVGAGPSFAFNISGKSKYDDGTTIEEDDIKFGNDKDNDDMKSLDEGINFLAGYEFSNGLFLSAVSNLGLRNMSLYSDDDESIKSKYFSIKVGFMFGKRK